MISRLRMIAAIATAMVLLASPALATHSWSVYHFPSDNLSPTVTGETRLADVSDVVDDWAGLETNILPSYAASGSGDIKVVAKRGNPNWIGLAQIKIDSAGHILEGKVTLNSAYANYNNGNGTANIWKHVLCQEVGHILGLQHSGGDTCMNDAFETLGMYTGPDIHDAKQLNLIYDGHVDVVGGTGDPDDGAGGPDCNKNANAKKCRTGAGQWITLHVLSMPPGAIGR
ncbi:MAG: hypothetical protein O7D28_07570 [Actinobacteria bacterium]|nr:hypothetical protein [Actinomycetota bacterium]